MVAEHVRRPERPLTKHTQEPRQEQTHEQQQTRAPARHREQRRGKGEAENKTQQTGTTSDIAETENGGKGQNTVPISVVQFFLGLGCERSRGGRRPHAGDAG